MDFESCLGGREKTKNKENSLIAAEHYIGSDYNRDVYKYKTIQYMHKNKHNAENI